MSIDDFMKQIEDDERADRAELESKLTPIDYGRLRGIAPQRVYQAIRNGKLEVERCLCGRKVIDVAQADIKFGFKDPISEVSGAEDSDPATEANSDPATEANSDEDE
jgi:hypothetical protein